MAARGEPTQIRPSARMSREAREGKERTKELNRDFDKLVALATTALFVHKEADIPISRRWLRGKMNVSPPARCRTAR